MQVLHVSVCHWAVVSNICREGHLESIGYYDSAHPFTIGVNLWENVCSFYKNDAAFVHFDIVNVMEQPNAHDCGVFALANATELAHNCDPALCHSDVKSMREHLLHCLEQGKIERFPSYLWEETYSFWFTRTKVSEGGGFLHMQDA